MTTTNSAFGLTFGAAFMALVFDLMYDSYAKVVSVFAKNLSSFYGAAMLLVLQYFHHNKDRLFLRALVLALTVLSNIHIGAYTALMYRFLISGVLHPELLLNIPPVELSLLLMLGTSDSVHEEIGTLSDGKLLYIAPLFLLSLTGLAGGLGQMITSPEVYDWLRAERKTISGVTDETSRFFNGLSIIATALCDIMITCILCHTVNYKRTGLSSTDRMINSLIAVAIARGALTSVAAILNAIFIFARPDTFLFALFVFPTTQFYIFSVVGSLNYRKHLRGYSNQSNTWVISGLRIASNAFSSVGRATIVDPDYENTARGLELHEMPQSTHVRVDHHVLVESSNLGSEDGKEVVRDTADVNMEMDTPEELDAMTLDYPKDASNNWSYCEVSGLKTWFFEPLIKQVPSNGSSPTQDEMIQTAVEHVVTRMAVLFAGPGKKMLEQDLWALVDGMIQGAFADLKEQLDELLQAYWEYQALLWKLDHLETKNLHLKEQVSSQESQLEEKDKELARLKSFVRHFKGDIQSSEVQQLRAALEAQDGEIEELKKKLAASEEAR
ncbi:hypothetical protein GYMLUDRAFT_262259 [Collybiopsis luxurians FD-317 M1]|uniref:DUF6534 domain-containing protein n=1 Tax=Collybiopsis luxurians FD-317 M1 TaxID=944289 RepID=A0A0D0C8R7_9AGAR|nr:hypothetical protein GYMLUDRAFT_262259 [Collybiopsis luxurians FD-317 M1]